METNSDKLKIKAQEFFDEKDKEITDRGLHGFHHDSTIVELMQQFANQQLAELQKQLDVEIQVANAQVEIVEEMDEEISELKEQVEYRNDLLIDRNEEIASLKEALRKAQNLLHTIEVYDDSLDEEIEQLLKEK